MARVIFSPMISSLSGKVADAVFARWKGINYIRSRVIPANPQSDLQTAQRLALAHTLTMWQSIKAWATKHWDHYAEGYAKSGYNRYMEDNILDVKAAVAGQITPYNKDYIKVTYLDIVAGTAGQIVCTWTNVTGISGKDWLTTHWRKTETLKEEYAWTLDSDTDITDGTVTIDGLADGEEYEVAIFAADGSPAGFQESLNKVLAAGV